MDELMTTAEVAQMYRKPESTMRYYRHAGIGPKGFRLGRSVVYRRSEVLAWLADQEARASTGGAA